MDEFERRLRGYRLMTMEVLYYRPDHRSILQSFAWQFLDLPPSFDRARRFLDHWRDEIEAPIHSIRLAHSELLLPGEPRIVKADFLLN